MARPVRDGMTGSHGRARARARMRMKSEDQAGGAKHFHFHHDSFRECKSSSQSKGLLLMRTWTCMVFKPAYCWIDSFSCHVHSPASLHLTVTIRGLHGGEGFSVGEQEVNITLYPKECSRTFRDLFGVSGTSGTLNLTSSSSLSLKVRVPEYHNLVCAIGLVPAALMCSVLFSWQ